MGDAPHRILQYKKRETQRRRVGGNEKKRYKRQLAKVTDGASLPGELKRSPPTKRDNPKYKKKSAVRIGICEDSQSGCLSGCVCALCLLIFHGPRRVTESEDEADKRDERRRGTTWWVLVTQCGVLR